MTENEIGYAIIGAAMKVLTVSGLAIRAVYSSFPRQAGIQSPETSAVAPCSLPGASLDPRLRRVTASAFGLVNGL